MTMLRCLAALAAALACGTALADTRPSLCRAGETAIFSCAIGGKTASLCASADLGPSQGSLTYRFGRKGAIELTHPEAPALPDQAFSTAVVGDAGFAGDIVRFNRGETRYTLYSIIVKGQGERDGIRVSRAGRQLADLRCKDFALGADAWKLLYRAKLPKAEPASLD
ncbi:hypothetical protein [Bosea sp. (in: a-proteobacteria)]|jgi:hypothetical protein|uniref:hypothetical protein n=1 Tax=Bosea sp. (in: a-proteobacteria) TaxID=1871050 RepID=UPI002DDD9777|nr:hypothetical protein [Bosea sp. (in: a-proteobacteria)]HEV2512342.1 hypothetical protein [Bosea sp. (in: a-proteobacteria)]